MTQERYIPIQPGSQDIDEEEQEQPRPKHSAAHLFETPNAEDNDIYTDDLTDLTDEDVFGGDTDMSDLTEITDEEVFGGDLDLSDLTTVSQEQIYGKPQRRSRKQKATRKPESPDTSLGGMNV